MIARRSALALPALLARPATAQPAWPDRPVRVLVPVPAGAAPDLVARELAEHLARRFGRPFPVENRPGGDGLIGVEAMLAARPGEALLVTATGAVTLVPVLRNPPLPVDPLEAALPIAALAADGFGLFVAPGVPADSLAGLVAHARAAGPETLNWFAAVGPPTLVMHGFLREAGLSAMTLVTYRGVPPALLDLVAGRLHLLFAPIASGLPLLREGRLRLLATAGRARSAAAPDAPSVAEAGFPALLQEGTIGLFGWRGMPAEIAASLAAEADAAMAPLGERLVARGQAPRPERLRDFAALLAADRARLGALARAFPPPPA